MPPVGFEPTISAGVRPQTYALDRAATGTGAPNIIKVIKYEGMRLAGTVGHMWEFRNVYRIFGGKI